MKRLLRTLLTWLLLAAVPLQGYAASAMLFCGAAHARTDAVVDHAAHGHAGHAHDQDAVEDTIAAGTDGHQSSSLDPSGLMHGGCSVCASCCSGAALPAATITAAFAQPHASPSQQTEHAAPDQTPARLERPPRTALA